MHISVAAVTSLDGRLTRHDETDIYKWVSAEDQDHFRMLVAEHDAIVMGRGTYEAIREHLKLDTGKLRVVLTSEPEQFNDQNVAGQLEFVSTIPTELVKNLEARGIKKVLVAGGTHMITDFLQNKLVDDFYLTLEPYFFGQGKLLMEGSLDLDLELLNYHQLNNRGTLMLKYKVSKQN